jgi:hypothetical protein
MLPWVVTASTQAILSCPLRGSFERTRPVDPTNAVEIRAER